MNRVVREINLGRVTGLSAYELAVKHGYEGTEAEYVAKQEAMYNKIIELSKTICGFSKITCGDKSIESSLSKHELNIETDGSIDVLINPNTNTIKLSISEDFKESIVHSGDDDIITQED